MNLYRIAYKRYNLGEPYGKAAMEPLSESPSDIADSIEDSLGTSE